MRVIVVVLGLLVLISMLRDAFETIILPRTVLNKRRLTGIFYELTWRPWTALVRRLRSEEARETLLGYYGPLSLIVLLVLWASGLVLGFALLEWGLGVRMVGPDGPAGFVTMLYTSGVTFLTLGYGDVIARDTLGRVLTVLEAGTGFGFLAIVIGYLPVVYQAFSRREVAVSLLDEQAGSPPSAGELLRRHGLDGSAQTIDAFLHEWERWSAEVLESHLSYPTLGYFRSQHENQSWLGALTMILDACALLMVGVEGSGTRQARLTFAMARHAVIDLAQVFVEPSQQVPDRLPPAALQHLRATLMDVGIVLRAGPAADQQLAELRALYEPYVWALAEYLLIPLPAWCADDAASDNWQRTAQGQANVFHAQ